MPSTSLKVLARDADLGPGLAGVAYNDGSYVDTLLPRFLFLVSNAAPSTGLECLVSYWVKSLTAGEAWLEGSSLSATPLTAPLLEDPITC